jgi:asparagine synthase (glutamine-hydrolysing)
MPPEVAHPSQPENFLNLMQSGLRRHGLPIAKRMLDRSLLIDAGYVDGDAFARAVVAAGHATIIPDILYDTIALEVGLLSMMEDR